MRPLALGLDQGADELDLAAAEHHPLGLYGPHVVLPEEHGAADQHQGHDRAQADADSLHDPTHARHYGPAHTEFRGVCSTFRTCG